MSSSALSELYRKAFAKRLQERAAGVSTKPDGLAAEESEAYNDADLAFLAKNSVNERVKSRSAKYRKAYHQRLYNAVSGSSNMPPSDNAEIEEAKRNANMEISNPNVFIDEINQKMLAF